MRPMFFYDYENLPLLPKLIHHYLQGKPEVMQLCAYSPRRESFAETISRRKQFPLFRDTLVQVLEEQYRTLAIHPKVSENIRVLKRENTFTVTAAHQPCLFGGPLYNIYKICHTIKLAQTLREMYHEYYFVPVFWLGTEDHDTKELSHAFINGKKIVWEHAYKGPSGRWPVTGIGQLSGDAAWSEHQNDAYRIWFEAAERCDVFGKLVQFFLHTLFQEYGLVVIDQNHPELKALLKEVILQDVLHQKTHSIMQPTLAFLDKNYHVQARPREVNFFYISDTSRERIIWKPQNASYQIGQSGASFTAPEMTTEISARPERFSPNVILRPVYQEIVLPNVAFVGGAAELSYWLELKAVFDAYGVAFPALMMRNTATLLRLRDVRKLEKTGLVADVFFQPKEVTIKKFITEHLDEEKRLDKEKEQIDKIFNIIIQKASDADSTLLHTAQAEKIKVLAGIDALQQKILRAEKRKNEQLVRQINDLYDVFCPEGEWQERRENFIPFYTQNMFEVIIRNFDPFEPGMHIFALA
ncbi:MAG: bacillithiol biosynthesis cysteine-adding enzyme BshC [Chitinophagales bacterium]|nr:bacillithiol biosynthesis cysteine-adding enzyme BshC [Chitinophagales bacterium]MDW8418280.1 bacillithiol biosynthesis cysteine-adding enzyme BshC [Chitinophagales bacterium]